MGYRTQKIEDFYVKSKSYCRVTLRIKSVMYWGYVLIVACVRIIKFLHIHFVYL